MTRAPTRSAAPNMTDYEEERRRFRLDVPERFNYVSDVVAEQARRRPDDVALLSLDENGEVARRQTYADLVEEAARVAHGLRSLGIGKGDRIFVMLPRIPEFYSVMLGAIAIGAVPMPATNQLTTRDMEYRIERAEALAAVTDPSGAARLDAATRGLDSLQHRIIVGEAPSDGWLPLERLVEGAPTKLDPAWATQSDDPMLLYFTSGTVSLPKMVLHTQASYGLGHNITARYWQDLKPGDVHWAISDTGWAKAAWGKLFGQFAMGATVVQMNMGKPEPELILEVLRRHRITTFCAPPTIYRMLILADIGAYDLRALRHCMAAGEPLNPEVIRVWGEGTGGLSVYDGYGQTETTNLVANYRCLPVRAGSMGRPCPGYDVDVVDEDGAPVPVDAEGHIAVRISPTRPVGLFAGYFKDAEATQNAMRNGCYFTGDRARKDADGYFWFEGRSDDVITSSAYRIGPFEVESALVSHPAVMEAAVVGKDDPERTQIVTAFVILSPGHEPGPALARELQDHVKAVTAPYKYPREVHFVTALPKTVSGKIRRVELREQLRSGALPT